MSYRSHTCGELSVSHKSSFVKLSGWAHRIRDFGGLLFIDLRDHFGITQIVVSPSSPAFALAATIRSEWVISVSGKVVERSEDTVNPKLSTGYIEVLAEELEVLSEAKELPVPVFGELDYPEDMRLTYRFLDLRRDTLHGKIKTRSKIIRHLRSSMEAMEFEEYSTPIMTTSSPEGARDFLIPSRLHAGNFYALPQSPQQYKQLLMVSGFDKYFQIAPCFRDEAPRSDRLPGEFYQLDMEMSFVDQDMLLSTMEPVILDTFKKFTHTDRVSTFVPRISYQEALEKYGTDKPDLRNPIIIGDTSSIFRGAGFGIFAKILASDETATIRGIPIKEGGSRALCDRMNAWAISAGYSGLGYIFWKEEDGKLVSSGPISKALGDELTEKLRLQFSLSAGSALFFAAGKPEAAHKLAGEARTKLGVELSLIDDSKFEFCWIVDFPFFEWNTEEKKIDFSHNPFSMPQTTLDTDDLLSIKAYQFDMVCNGYEIASGGIRNHKPDLMVKAFGIAGISKETVEERFGGMYKAFQYGAPPHGGMAFGVDRLVMLITESKNLREVTPFPMNQQAKDMLMGGPLPATPQQLRELSIRIVK